MHKHPNFYKHHKVQNDTEILIYNEQSQIIEACLRSLILLENYKALNSGRPILHQLMLSTPQHPIELENKNIWKIRVNSSPPPTPLPPCTSMGWPGPPPLVLYIYPFIMQPLRKVSSYILITRKILSPCLYGLFIYKAFIRCISQHSQLIKFFLHLLKYYKRT